MIERDKVIDTFLSETPWATWTKTPLTGDASARRYMRLCNDGDTVILMDDTSEPSNSTQSFARVAHYLRDHALCAPNVLAHDPNQGLMILSDLGHTDYAQWLAAHPGDASDLYRAAADVLIHLHNSAPPAELTLMTPQVAADMVMIVGDHYAHCAMNDVAMELQRTMTDLDLCADRIALRDFHAENLIWRPDRDGWARVGLLDFQDAFIAPAGYDLASLLRDVRRDMSDPLSREMITYFMDHADVGADFPAQLACLGAQRNLRILGVFARLAQRMGKKRYIDLIPRVWSNLMRDLNHPALEQLKKRVCHTIPEPSTALLNRLRQ